MEAVEDGFVKIKEEPKDLLETVESPVDELNASAPLFEASYIETDNKTLKYKCPMCNKKYKTIEKVQWHVNTHITFHSVTTNGSYKCLECDRSCENADDFQEHIKTHKRTRGRPKKGSVSSCESIKLFVCDQCGKRFKRNQELLNHSFVHCDIKLYECSHCTKPFKLKQQLQNHLKVHIEIRPFVCINCDKSFKFKQQLENHAKSHSELRPFPCNICDKGFKFKQQLQMHLKTHDDFRPYSCEFCDKKFKLKQQLQCHNRVHSGERPFQCFTCGKSFQFKQQLQKHFQVHKKQVDLESEENDVTLHSEASLDENCDVDLEDLIPEMELFGKRNTSNGELDEDMEENNEQEPKACDTNHEDVTKSIAENMLQSEIKTEGRREVNIEDLIPKVEIRNDGSVENSSCTVSKAADQIDTPMFESCELSDTNKDEREVNVQDLIPEIELRNGGSIEDSNCRILETVNQNDTPVSEGCELSVTNKERHEVNIENLVPEVELRIDGSTQETNCTILETVDQSNTPVFESDEFNSNNLCGEIMEQTNGDCSERT